MCCIRVFVSYDCQTPGPGQYKVTSPEAYKRKGPQYSITGRTPVVTDNTRKPGPGAHSPEKVINKKPTMIQQYCLTGISEMKWVVYVRYESLDHFD